MKFEEALTLMRQGKKITHSALGDNVWLQACTVGFLFDETPLEQRPISIVKMLGDCEHPDMRPDFDEVFKEPCKHGYNPQLNLFLVMAEDWELYLEN